MDMLENHNPDIHSVKGMGIILLGGSSLAERDAVITSFSEYTASRNEMVILSY